MIGLTFPICYWECLACSAGGQMEQPGQYMPVRYGNHYCCPSCGTTPVRIFANPNDSIVATVQRNLQECGAEQP